LALPHDMIGIATTNALPTMAPWGGIDKIVGINPLAVAIPSGDETPIVLDIAFGATALVAAAAAPGPVAPAWKAEALTEPLACCWKRESRLSWLKSGGTSSPSLRVVPALR